MSLESLTELQARLKPKCHIFLGHEKYSADAFFAGVETERNEYPYWIKYNAETLSGAVELLLAFFEGVVPDHADRKRTAKDFLCQG